MYLYALTQHTLHTTYYWLRNASAAVCEPSRAWLRCIWRVHILSIMCIHVGTFVKYACTVRCKFFARLPLLAAPPVSHAQVQGTHRSNCSKGVIVMSLVRRPSLEHAPGCPLLDDQYQLQFGSYVHVHAYILTFSAFPPISPLLRVSGTITRWLLVREKHNQHDANTTGGMQCQYVVAEWPKIYIYIPQDRNR